MVERLLLDTHIWWWWVNGSNDLSRVQARKLKAISAESPALVCDISLWEIAMLHGAGRIKLKMPLREWLEQASAPPLVERIALSPAIVTEINRLPDSFHKDPADRLIVAAARVMGATLLTQDARIIDAKVVPTIA